MAADFAEAVLKYREELRAKAMELFKQGLATSIPDALVMAEKLVRSERDRKRRTE